MPDVKIHAAPAGLVLDDRIRGFPAGHAPLAAAEITGMGWKPHDGVMSLPLLSLDRAAFEANVDWMMRYVRAHGLQIAPHAKTPMSPAIAAALIGAGAWGTTVADIRQASVMLHSGLSRLIIANEIGGPSAARRLAAMLRHHPDAELHIFIDSLATAEALEKVWRDTPDLPTLGLLVEVGAARGGARTLDAVEEILDFILARETETFRLSGAAAYEGAAATADAKETAQRISGLMTLTAEVYRIVRKRVGQDRPLIVTAGGSVYFDMVVQHLGPLVLPDKAAILVLRSGAIFFHDHGVYERGLAALDARGGFIIDGLTEKASNRFQPALRAWAEVLSRPQAGLAICGMGLRDAAIDQGLPRPLALHRGDTRHGLDGASISKLNDQHAFVEWIGDLDVQIGDVIEFGLSHPCTCLDRHAVLYGLDASHTVTAVFPTSFG